MNNLEETILLHISKSGVSRVNKKEIRRHIKSSTDGHWSKKDIKRALKQLVSNEQLCKESDEYFIPVSNASDSEEDDDSVSESSEELSTKQTFVPIAQRIRHQPQDKYVELPAGKVESTEASKKQVDLDEEIRRLEAELAADSPSDEDDVSDNDDEGSLSDMDDGRKRQVSFGQNSTLTFQRDSDSDHSEVQSDDNINGSGIICLSESANERIEPLPASAMPQIARKTAYDHVKKSKKRKLDKEEHTVNEGLKQAVKDILDNYKSRSEVQQTPWYCRICQHQAADEAEFISHRESEFHKTAVSEHQRKTYCKMCRKRMTSVIQFEEHLRSRPHREMLGAKRAQQQGRGRGDGRMGRGREGRFGRGYGSSKRQWC
jgi:hypothetical protein